MSYVLQRCPICGGEVHETDGGNYKCEFCNAEMTKKEGDDYVSSLKVRLKLLSGTVEESSANAQLKKEEENIARARRNLYEAVHRENIDTEEVLNLCYKLKLMVDDDFLADFYEVASKGNYRDINRFLDNIDVSQHSRTELVRVLDYVMNPIRIETVPSIRTLVERVFETDPSLREQYDTKIDEDERQLNDGTYDVTRQRDVFLAYKSEDFQKVNELLDLFCENKISCFVSSVNLQHGGSAEDYKTKIRQAIDNCRVLVFVSTKLSRSSGDARFLELPYVQQKDEERAPVGYITGDYKKLLSIYKKPRVEYLAESYTRGNPSEDFCRIFFDGFDQKRSPQTVLDAVKKILDQPNFLNDIKICVHCGTDNPVSANFCYHCQSSEFVRNYKEFAEFKMKESAEKSKTIEEKGKIIQEKDQEVAAKVQEINDLKNAKDQELAAKDQEIIDLKKKNKDLNYSKGLVAIKQGVIDRRDKEINDLKEQNKDLKGENRELKKKEKEFQDQLAQEKARSRIEGAKIEKAERKEAFFKFLCLFAGLVSCISLAAFFIIDAALGFNFNFYLGDAFGLAAVCCLGAAALFAFISIASLIAVWAYSGLGFATGITGFFALGVIVTAIVFGVISGFYTRRIELEVSNDGTLTHVFADQSVAELVIPDEVDGVAVTSIGDSAFSDCDNLGSITIPAGIISIGPGAFSECDILKKIVVDEGNEFYHVDGNCLIETDSKILVVGFNDSVIPDDGSVVSIGERAFERRTSISRISLPDSITEIGARAFARCNSLIEIVIPDSVTRIGEGAFFGCSAIKRMALPFVGGEAASVASHSTLLGYVFGEEKFAGAEKITQNYSDSESAAFYIPASLREVTVAGGDILYGAFDNCSMLESVVVSDRVSEIEGGAFSGCSSLQSITLPFVGGTAGAKSPSAATLFGYIFGTGVQNGVLGTMQDFGGSRRPIYNIPASLRRVTITGGNILYGAFYNCSMLESISIPESVSIIEPYSFFYCTSLKSIELPLGITKVRECAFNGCGSLSSVVLPDGVTEIGGKAFSDCISLSEIVIPDSVTEIGEDAFSDCTSLESVTIGRGVAKIKSSAFSECTALSEINFCAVRCDDFNEDNTLFLNAGNERSGITVNFSSDVTRVPAYVFYRVSEITDIAFASGSQCKTIGEYAFAGTTIETLVIPYGVEVIENNALGGCLLLESIDIPDSVTAIEEQTFYNCQSLEEIELPEGITSIGAYTFKYCSSLESIVIPSSVIMISSGAFDNCSLFDQVYYCGDAADWNDMIIYDDQINYADIYYYSESRPTGSGSYWHYVDGIPTIWY